MLFLIYFLLIQCLFVNSEFLRQLKDKQSTSSSISNSIKRVESEKRFHLKWISDQTQFPFSFQLPHYDKELIDYDWYKYDKDTYVTKLDNYRPNYFVSKQPYKTKLTLFSYNFQTHEQLTTYEPKRIFDYIDSTEPKYRDLFTLLLLQSHRIRIDRAQDHVNVTCLADFLIDKSSMDESSNDLLQQVKDLALFNINLNEEMKNYIDNPIRQSWSKNHMLNYKKANHIGYGKQAQQAWKHASGTIKLARRRNQRKPRSLFYYDASDLNGNLYDYETDLENEKMFYRIRLGMGPIRVNKPFDQSLISCDLDLINADDVNLDHRSRVFKYLFKEDIGMDKDDDLDKEYDEGFVIVSELSENYETSTTTVETTTVETTTESETTKLITTTTTTSTTTSTLSTTTNTSHQQSTTTTTTTVAEPPNNANQVIEDNNVSIVNFIPRYLIQSNDTYDDDVEHTTTVKSFVKETNERIKRPTLLFLVDNPIKNSQPKTIQINLNTLFIFTIFYLFIYSF